MQLQVYNRSYRVVNSYFVRIFYVYCFRTIISQRKLNTNISFIDLCIFDVNKTFQCLYYVPPRYIITVTLHICGCNGLNFVTTSDAMTARCSSRIHYPHMHMCSRYYYSKYYNIIIRIVFVKRKR